MIDTLLEFLQFLVSALFGLLSFLVFLNIRGYKLVKKKAKKIEKKG